LFRSSAEGLAFLRAVNAAEANTFSAVVVQNFDGVAIEDGDDGASEVGEHSHWLEQKQKKAGQTLHPSPPAMLLPPLNVSLDLVRDTRWDILLCT
jgi:hypothetical protein